MVEGKTDFKQANMPIIRRVASVKKNLVTLIPFLIVISILGIIVSSCRSIQSTNIKTESTNVASNQTLDLFRNGYPRLFHFRRSEKALDRGETYDEWEQIFAPYDGIMGKVLEEEVPGRGYNIPYFTRFKATHSNKLVMLHFNGRARDPRYNIEPFYAGHWLYYEGSKSLQDIAAIQDDTTIKVQDVNLFKINMGRGGDNCEDLVIVRLDEDGKPDWSYAEQVKLISRNLQENSIIVRRSLYGTQPLNFAAGKTLIAAHVTEGPWGNQSNLAWSYNYSLDCPKDQDGKTCIDVLVEDVAAHFLPGGDLENFDGIEFDTLYHEIFDVKKIARGVDTNGDGLADNGYRDGINQYGKGVYLFLETLRKRLGNQKLILADGREIYNQRAFDQLNGIESEAFLSMDDYEASWSNGANRFKFWTQNARKPVLNYINHKYNGAENDQQIPINIDRFAMAAAQILDIIFTYSAAPKAGYREIEMKTKGIPIWDELVKGKENELGWLGMPQGPAVSLARQTPDLFKEGGISLNPDFMQRLEGLGVNFKKLDNRLEIALESTEDEKHSIKEVLLFEDNFEDDNINADKWMYSGLWNIQSRMLRSTYSEEYKFKTYAQIKQINDFKDGTIQLRLKGHTLSTEDSWLKIFLREVSETDSVIIQFKPAAIRFGTPQKLNILCNYRFNPETDYDIRISITNKQLNVKVKEAGEERYQEFSNAEMQGISLGENSGGIRIQSFKDFSFDDIKVWKELQNGESNDYPKVTDEKNIRTRDSLDSKDSIVFKIKDVNVTGPDLSVFCTFSAKPMTNYPAAMGRTVKARIIEKTGAKSKDLTTFINDKDFEAGFYFNNVQSSTVDIELEVESTEKIWLSAITAYAYPDVYYREFGKGLVLLNPSMHPFDFKLKILFPGKNYRKLFGTEHQDPITNNGEPVGEKVTVGKLDGLFLVKEN